MRAKILNHQSFVNNSAPPLIVSIQRTGFSLLIDLVSEIKKLRSPALSDNPGQQALNKVVPFISNQLNLYYQKFFDDAGMGQELLFNGEFQLLVGGPKWTNNNFPDDLFVRKYFGVKDKGDFLLVARYPKELFGYYGIMHSSNSPSAWLNNDDYKTHNYLTSYRNPIGVFNSAVHSINALTSEYIQRYLPAEDEHEIRRQIALNKFSDPMVCDGLIKYQMKYWHDYLPIASKFKYYRWENLIEQPVKTIRHIANMVGEELTDEQAEAIWAPRDHKNLLMFHQHNFRKGKGIVGEWRNNVINEHLDLFKEYGAESIFDSLNYEFPEYFKPENHTPFQREIEQYWRSGKPYEIADSNLEGFAFNKSNIDVSQFNFDSFPVIDRVEIERSTFTDSSFLKAFHVYAEEITEKISDLARSIVTSDGSQKVVNNLVGQLFDKKAAKSFTASVFQSNNQLYNHLVKQLADLPINRNIALWGLGTDFSQIRTTCPEVNKILSQDNIYLIDGAKAGEFYLNKKISTVNEVPEDTLLIPTALSYQTRTGMSQLAERLSLEYLDLYANE